MYCKIRYKKARDLVPSRGLAPSLSKIKRVNKQTGRSADRLHVWPSGNLHFSIQDSPIYQVSLLVVIEAVLLTSVQRGTAFTR